MSRLGEYAQLQQLWWQLPLIVLFLLWWVAGASYLQHLFIRRFTGLRTISYGSCVLASFLAGMGTAVVAGLVYLLAARITETKGFDPSGDSRRWGIIPAGIAAIPMALLLLYAVLQMPLRQLLKASVVPLASVAVLGAVIAAGIFYGGRPDRLWKVNNNLSIERLRTIQVAIGSYGDYFRKEAPPDLPILAQEITVRRESKILLAKENLRCPFVPKAGIGYFYLPYSLDANSGQKLRACEFRHSESGRGRAALFADRVARFVPAPEFQRLLRLPENAEFAAHLKEEEAKR